MENIFEQLHRHTFSGKMAFLNPNSRQRTLLQSGAPFNLMCLMGVCKYLSIPYGLIEADAYDMTDTEVIAALKKGRYNYVGIPLVALQVSKIFPLLERIKRETPTRLIVGGPLPTADTQWLMESCRAIDYAVLGEGDALLPQLLLAIEKNLPLDEIPGVAYWDNNNVLMTRGKRQLLPGDVLPIPDFDTIDYRYYPGAPPVKAWPSANIFASRGCPYQCTFCCNPIWSCKPRYIPVPTVITWLEILAEKGVREVCFNDDTLNINSQWFEELCLSILRHGLHNKMVFKGYFRADLTQFDQLTLAKKAGFWLIYYGVESGSQAILNYYKKGQKIEDIARAIELTKAADLKVFACFIIGAPIETPDTLLETLHFIRTTDPTYAPFQMLIPFIGAKISEDFIKFGLLTLSEIRAYDHTHPTIRSLSISTQEILELSDFMRKEVVNFKNSAMRRLNRRQDLQQQGLAVQRIIDQLEYETKEAACLLESTGQPNSQFFDRKHIDLSWMTDTILLCTPDIRLDPGEWHLAEKNLRWSLPVFELPFFLKHKKRYLEIYWASMRLKVKVKMILSASERDFMFSLTITDPDWHRETIELPKAINGPVWTKFEIHPPFFAPNDPRQLGMAFRSIRFLDGRSYER